MIGTLRSLSTVGFMWVNHWLRCALPGHCAFCLGETPRATHWCANCLEQLPWNDHACVVCAEPMATGANEGNGAVRCGVCLTRPPVFDGAWAPLRYEDEVARLMQTFKFAASPRAGMLLLSLLEAGLEARIGASVGQHETFWPTRQGIEAIIPVPLHPRRARERGFDQADWLGRRLASRMDLPVIKARRKRVTPTQRGLARQARRSNLRDAFMIDSPLPQSVLLLDDVMTTGATFDALAQACRAAGARRIEVWAVARTPKR